MNTLKHRISLGLVALVVAMSAQAQAQGGAAVAPDKPAAPAAHRGHPPSEAERAKFAAKFKERIEKHQAALHDKLKLTSAQEPAWKSFVDSVTPTALPMPFDRKAFEGLNAPARLEKMLDRLKEHEAKMQSHLTALKSLYAVLTPEQQKIMDDDIHHMMERFRGIRQWRGHGAEHKHGAEHAQK